MSSWQGRWVLAHNSPGFGPGRGLTAAKTRGGELHTDDRRISWSPNTGASGPHTTLHAYVRPLFGVIGQFSCYFLTGFGIVRVRCPFSFVARAICEGELGEIEGNLWHGVHPYPQCWGPYMCMTLTGVCDGDLLGIIMTVWAESWPCRY